MEELYKDKDGQLSFVEPSNQRSLYKYAGPVFLFDQHRYIATVKVKTWANTPGKAYSNLLYQIRNQLGYRENTKIFIKKELIKKEELKYGKTI